MILGERGASARVRDLREGGTLPQVREVRRGADSAQGGTPLPAEQVGEPAGGLRDAVKVLQHPRPALDKQDSCFPERARRARAGKGRGVGAMRGSRRFQDVSLNGCLVGAGPPRAARAGWGASPSGQGIGGHLCRSLFRTPQPIARCGVLGCDGNGSCGPHQATSERLTAESGPSIMAPQIARTPKAGPAQGLAGMVPSQAERRCSGERRLRAREADHCGPARRG